MKKIYFFLLAICLMGAACKKNEEPLPGGNTNEKEKSLKDTRWKLAGIVNAETGVLTELEPNDCEWCYTLVFDFDSSAIGGASPHLVFVDLSKNENPIIRIFGPPLIIDQIDAPFYNAVKLVTSYSYEGN